MSESHYTTREACEIIARHTESGSYTRQAFWQRVESLGLKPWREHGRKSWWTSDQVMRIVSALGTREVKR